MGWGYISLEPFFPMRPSTSLDPQKANPVIAHILKLAVQTVLQPGWKIPKSPFSCGTSLQDLGYVVLSLHVIVQASTCCVTPDRGETQERHSPKCPDRVRICRASCKGNLRSPLEST